MKRLVVVGLAVALVGLAGTAPAQEKANPTGTWKWTTEFGGQSREQTLKLKLDGDKLTGSMPGRDNQETQIEEATFKDGTVTFKASRERNGQKSTTKYTAQGDGDPLKGPAEAERDGEARKQEFEAKRESK